ncbi:MAG: site-specific DNA-methyltransferase [Alphaproteobacteria bacterium]|nr:site-specific DNA-methyltransferase [Alphaproteobacteria bacterium]
MPTTSFVTLPYKLERGPPPFEGQDIKYPESLVRHFLTQFTRKGQKVFDPFAGLGTTLFVAEEMGRVPYGIEYDPDRHGWTAGQMTHWQNLIHGDSAQMQRLGLPKMDFCMSSPPFMRKNSKWNPLYAGNPAKAGYAVYISRMVYIYAQLTGLMKRNAYVVVQLDNIPGRVFTPLVWDLGHALSAVMKPAGEVIVRWENGPPTYSHTHCLLFRNSL